MAGQAVFSGMKNTRGEGGTHSNSCAPALSPCPMHTGKPTGCAHHEQEEQHEDEEVAERHHVLRVGKICWQQQRSSSRVC